MISNETLSSHTLQGGKNVLDVKARNKVINLIKMQRYVVRHMDQNAQDGLE